mmetsp:Transcript_15791/g.25713  ORF Transcript_15791/g.25713 Transcript_15791/m.25713 type:complete len:442 (-) Transcript_15791:200-1525(-)
MSTQKPKMLTSSSAHVISRSLHVQAPKKTPRRIKLEAREVQLKSPLDRKEGPRQHTPKEVIPSNVDGSQLTYHVELCKQARRALAAKYSQGGNYAQKECNESHTLRQGEASAASLVDQASFTRRDSEKQEHFGDCRLATENQDVKKHSVGSRFVHDTNPKMSPHARLESDNESSMLRGRTSSALTPTSSSMIVALGLKQKVECDAMPASKAHHPQDAGLLACTQASSPRAVLQCDDTVGVTDPQQIGFASFRAAVSSDGNRVSQVFSITNQDHCEKERCVLQVVNISELSPKLSQKSESCEPGQLGKRKESDPLSTLVDAHRECAKVEFATGADQPCVELSPCLASPATLHKSPSSRKFYELAPDKLQLGRLGSEKRRLAEMLAKWEDDKITGSLRESRFDKQMDFDIDVECAFTDVAPSTCRTSAVDIKDEGVFSPISAC